MANSGESRGWWEDRMRALEALFGNSDGTVTHAVIPFDFGYDFGGRADVVQFREQIGGVIYTTCELIGRDVQQPNSLGNYELAICHRHDEDWGINIIRSLAYYTLEAKIEPGETMDIGPGVPPRSSISAFLFLNFGQFIVRNRDAGVLLCIGITADELAECRNENRKKVEVALRSKQIYPFTDLFRPSALL
jgi:hypothetical protein